MTRKLSLGHDSTTFVRLLTDRRTAAFDRGANNLAAAHLCADFFTVEVLTWRGLIAYYLLFFLHLETRRVSLAGITRHPPEEWISQMGRNATDETSGYLDRVPQAIVSGSHWEGGLFERVRLPESGRIMNACMRGTCLWRACRKPASEWSTWKDMWFRWVTDMGARPDDLKCEAAYRL